MKRSQRKGRPSDARMPFTEHLEELRSRLIKCLIAVLLGFAVCFAFAEAIFSALAAPLFWNDISGVTLIGTGVAEAFFIELKVALYAAVALALPVILWQTWQFVAPGLYEHERSYARQFVLFGTLFFLLGVWFCYEVIFRLVYVFFLGRYEALGVRPAIRIGEYLSFASNLLLAFGISFELPVAAWFFARIGLIDHSFLIRHFRYAILLIFILAAILTPPDVVSQVLLAVPLTALYGLGIGAAYIAGRKDRQQAEGSRQQ